MDDAQALHRVAALAAAQDLPVPDRCLPGVARNLVILLGQARIVLAAAEHAPPDPAELLRP
jgi:hypothetical protein